MAYSLTIAIYDALNSSLNKIWGLKCICHVKQSRGMQAFLSVYKIAKEFQHINKRLTGVYRSENKNVSSSKNENRNLWCSKSIQRESHVLFSVDRLVERVHQI